MLQFGKYERPASVQEAYEIVRKSHGAHVVGGGVWLRLQNRRIACAVDLQDCGLNKIERIDFATGEVVAAGEAAAGEPAMADDAALANRAPHAGDAWSIGAMVTLRQLETHEAFNRATCGVFNAAVRDIVGTQVRNVATVGGSLFGRFGFSDVLCALLPLDCEVELAGAGRIPLAEFAAAKTYERDVLVRLIVRDHADYRANFQCVRRSATDFSVLNVCAAHWDGIWHVAVGARPARAVLLAGDELGLSTGSADAFTDEGLTRACERAAALPMSGNMRGSEAYRRHLASALTRRAILTAAGRDNAAEQADPQVNSIQEANRQKGGDRA